jgi:hypothetical protein
MLQTVRFLLAIAKGRVSVNDLSPDHRRGAVDSEDVSGHGEDLTGSFSFFLPHPRDRRQASDGLFIGRLQVGGIGGKQARQALGPRRPPRGFVSCQPTSHHYAVSHPYMVPQPAYPAPAHRAAPSEPPSRRHEREFLGIAGHEYACARVFRLSPGESAAIWRFIAAA